MRTTSWSSCPTLDETILGAGRLEQVRLLVDERLLESEQARMGRGTRRGLRDRIGGVLVAIGTAVAGGPTGVPSRRPIAGSAPSHRRTDLAHVGDGR